MVVYNKIYDVGQVVYIRMYEGVAVTPDYKNCCPAIILSVKIVQRRKRLESTLDKDHYRVYDVLFRQKIEKIHETTLWYRAIEEIAELDFDEENIL